MRGIVNSSFICHLQEFSNGLIVPFIVMTGSKESNTFAFVMYRAICEIEVVLHSLQQPPPLAPLFLVLVLTVAPVAEYWPLHSDYYESSRTMGCRTCFVL